jgi:hypothetical protein
MENRRYMPEKGDRFQAVLRRYKTDSRAGVCTCTQLHKQKKCILKITAVDEAGDFWIYPLEDFFFIKKAPDTEN